MKKGYGPSAPSAPWPPGGPCSGLFPALLVRASFRCAHSGARKCARIWTTWMANSLDDPFSSTCSEEGGLRLVDPPRIVLCELLKVVLRNVEGLDLNPWNLLDIVVELPGCGRRLPLQDCRRGSGRLCAHVVERCETVRQTLAAFDEVQRMGLAILPRGL